MPTYQYRCTEDHESEVVQSFTDEPLTACPTCGAAVRKVYGSVGVVFKGSGFYRNDSRDKKAASTTSAASDVKSETKSDSKSDSKSDAKPAATSTQAKESSASSGSSGTKSTSTSTSAGSAA